MCGDELPGGLATPEDYARFAEALVAARLPGHQAPHLDAAGRLARRTRMDMKACAAVREAVGPDMALMLDAYHCTAAGRRCSSAAS